MAVEQGYVGHQQNSRAYCGTAAAISQQWEQFSIAQAQLGWQAFAVLAEVPLFERPGRVMPSRVLPPEETFRAVSSAAISWRGDGQFFATVSCVEAGKPLQRVLLHEDIV